MRGPSGQGACRAEEKARAGVLYGSPAVRHFFWSKPSPLPNEVFTRHETRDTNHGLFFASFGRRGVRNAGEPIPRIHRTAGTIPGVHICLHEGQWPPAGPGRPAAFLRSQPANRSPDAAHPGTPGIPSPHAKKGPKSRSTSSPKGPSRFAISGQIQSIRIPNPIDQYRCAERLGEASGQAIGPDPRQACISHHVARRSRLEGRQDEACRAEEKGAQAYLTVQRPSNISSGANQVPCLRFSRNTNHETRDTKHETRLFSRASAVGW